MWEGFSTRLQCGHFDTSCAIAGERTPLTRFDPYLKDLCQMRPAVCVRGGCRETRVSQIWIDSFPFGRESGTFPISDVSLFCVGLEGAVVDMPHQVVENRNLIHGVRMCPVPDAVHQQFP